MPLSTTRSHVGRTLPSLQATPRHPAPDELPTPPRDPPTREPPPERSPAEDPTPGHPPEEVPHRDPEPALPDKSPETRARKRAMRLHIGHLV